MVFRISVFRRRLVALCLAALTGCVETSVLPDIPAQTPYVLISNGGSIFGGNTTTVYEGDVVVFRSDDGTAESVREGFAVLRSGGFARVRDVAVEVLAETGGAVVAAPACLDYGSDVLTVSSGTQIDASVSAGCPDTVVLAAQAEVRAALDAEIVD